MPKKEQKQKQKQKQSQVTKVSVKVGDTSKPKRRPRSAPAKRVGGGGGSISVVLQGAGLSVPNPPTQQYNEMVQAAEALRRQMALSGSLIPRQATNDLLNRVQATNPLTSSAGVTPMNTLIKPEGLEEEQVEGAMNIDPYTNKNFSAQVPIDQDWIRNVAMANLAQSFSRESDKIGVVEDVETIKDVDDYTRQETSEMSALVSSVPKAKKLSAVEATKKMSSPSVFTPEQKKERKKIREAVARGEDPFRMVFED